MLLLKLLLVPGLVALVTLAVRRWGPAVGGWLAGLPIVAGPVLVFYALEQGVAFAARAAHATITGLIGTVAFAVVYGQGASRLRWYLCVPLGWTVFATVILVMYFVQPGLMSSLVLLIAATVLGRCVLTRRVRFAESGQRSPARFEEPGLRPQGNVRQVPPVAASLGSTWSGLLNAFPVLTTIVAAFSHAQRGTEAPVAFLNGFLQAIVGLGLFCGVMSVGLEPLGLAWSLIAALVVQSTWHAIVLLRTALSARISRS